MLLFAGSGVSFGTPENLLQQHTQQHGVNVRNRSHKAQGQRIDAAFHLCHPQQAANVSSHPMQAAIDAARAKRSRFFAGVDSERLLC